MGNDQPLLTIPLVNEAVTGFYGLAIGGKRKGVETGINGDISADVNLPQVDDTGGFALQEVDEIVFLFRRGQAGRIGHRRQQNGPFRVIGDDFLGVARLQGIVPTVKQICNGLFSSVHGSHPKK